MSQPQMQHRPSVVNGVNRRRGDQDLGNRPESLRNEYQSFRSFRPGSSNHTGTGGVGQLGHQHFNHANSNFVGQAGSSKPAGDKVEAFVQGESRDGGQGPLNQHLVNLTACLIGQPVEVQVKNGSIYSGVFHTANAEKDYGIVLKMARCIRDGLPKGGKSDVVKDLAGRPVKTFIILAEDLVQIIAKDVPIGRDTLQNGRACENHAEIVTDSFLSQGRHGEVERELKPWTPDKGDPKDLGLESTFQHTWNRNWDQFETNKTLFGVESTFDEELYTTKLERGPQMREREREAWRIAREIEGQSTKNFHLAEERGVRLTKEFELLDEESRFSSVLRPNEDVGEENEDANADMHNSETFGNSFDHMDAAGSTEHECSPKKVGEAESSRINITPPADLNESKNGLVKRDPSLAVQDPVSALIDMHVAAGDSLGSMHKAKLPHVVVGDRSKRATKIGGLPSPLVSPLVEDITSIQALNLDPGCPQVTEDVYREFNVFRQQENAKRGKKQREDQVNELKSFSESLKDLTVRQHTTATAGGTRKTAAACAPPASALPIPTNITSSSSTLLGSDSGTPTGIQTQFMPSGNSMESARVMANEVDSISGLSQVELPSTSGVRSSSTQKMETPISPVNSATSTTAPSSPSSSSGILTGANAMKKSSLNPNAKEFKLNPNANSFTPSFTLPRWPSPVVQGPAHVPGVMLPVAPIQAMSMGVGVNPLLQQAGQPATKYTPYNSVAVPVASGGTPFLPSSGTYTPGVSGAAVPSALPGRQITAKMPPQLQQPAAGHSYSSQQPIRYTSQAPTVQPASTYLHPSGQLYSQQMMFGQPGHAVYFQQGPLMPPPLPVQAASQQPQPKHRGAGVPGMQLYVPPPFISGQQHFLPQVQMPQLSNPLQSTPGVLAPTTMSTIQPPQGMVPPAAPNVGGTISGNSMMRVGGKFLGPSFQQ